MHRQRAEQPEPSEPPERPRDRRLDEIFGPDLGTEERRTRGEERAREDWYRENRPPHHES